MVLANRNKQILFNWIVVPSVVLFIFSLLLGFLAISSVIMLILVVSVILVSVFGNDNKYKKSIFAEIKNGKLIVRPFGSIGWEPIEIDIAEIDKIEISASLNRNRYKLILASEEVSLDMERMLGISFNKAIDREFKAFMHENFKEKMANN